MGTTGCIFYRPLIHVNLECSINMLAICCLLIVSWCLLLKWILCMFFFSFCLFREFCLWFGVEANWALHIMIQRLHNCICRWMSLRQMISSFWKEVIFFRCVKVKLSFCFWMLLNSLCCLVLSNRQINCIKVIVVYCH